MNFMKYRLIYLLISGLIIGAGLFGLISWGLPLGVDFKGGATIEYKFENNISSEESTRQIESSGIEVSSVQEASGGSYIFKLGVFLRMRDKK